MGSRGCYGGNLSGVVLALVVAACVVQLVSVGDAHFIVPRNIRKLAEDPESVPKYLAPPLKLHYYKKQCPELEGIVQKVVAKYSKLDPTNPAPLLRLFFHDCFVQGCDGSVLLNSSRTSVAEKDAAINFSLTDFNIIDEMKADLEEKCPGVVSCADVLAVTAVYSIYQVSWDGVILVTNPILMMRQCLSELFRFFEGLISSSDIDGTAWSGN